MSRMFGSTVLVCALLAGCSTGTPSASPEELQPSAIGSEGEGPQAPAPSGTVGAASPAEGNEAGGEAGAEEASLFPSLDCEAEITGAVGDEAKDFFRAMGVCGDALVSARFVRGNARARRIRERLGKHFPARQGKKMVHLSTGPALDSVDDVAFAPEEGTHLTSGTVDHPLWAPAACYQQSKVTEAYDLTELQATLKVPAGAKSFRFEVNYFSAEYPEYVCTTYNDRFIALLESEALDGSKLPGGTGNNCVPNSERPTCNISFDEKGQQLTVNSGFFSICESEPNLPACAQPAQMLEDTGYDGPGTKGHPNMGGATGWLSTEASVAEGETIQLRFIVLDEGDGLLDSAVLLDNFVWMGKAVDAPSTIPVIY